MLITTVYDRLFVHFEELKVIVCYITKMLHKKNESRNRKGILLDLCAWRL